MHAIENIMRILTEEGIAFTQVDEPKNVGYGFGNGKWLQIDGGCKEAPLYIEFSEHNKVFDLHFGRYSYELFEYSEEGLLSELMNNIHAIMAEKTHIIWACKTNSGRWYADACYYVAPGEDDDDSAEYHAAIQRIERPRNMFSRFLTRRVTYAIYSWNTYREITR